jgi:predicted lipoprotein with Yx(FWY)xxD motif
MKRLASKSLLLIVLAALGVGTALAVAGPILKTSHNSKLGTILVSAKGLSLYHLTSEKNGSIKCTGQCTTFWFPVLWSGKGKPPLGPGVKAAMAGTVKRPSGSMQLTYNKFPLYRYYLDTKAGQTNGEAVNDAPGIWYAVSPAGQVVKPTGSGTTTQGTTTQGTTTSSRYP